jgi:hypothetical protein
MKSVKHVWGGKASIAAVAVALMLAACGGGGDTPTADATNPGQGGQTEQPNVVKVAGTVSGLTAAGLVLSNGTDTVTVPANASSFELPEGGVFAVAHQPLGFTQACEVGGTRSSPSVSCGSAVAKVSLAAGLGGQPDAYVDPLMGPDGRIYFATSQMVYSALPSGEGGYRVLAGSPMASGVADGQGEAARFLNIRAIQMDASGNVYVLHLDEARRSLIRKVTPTGTVTTIASGLGSPSHEVIDLKLGPNNQIYVLTSTYPTQTVERLTPQGQLELLFDTGTLQGTNPPYVTEIAVGADGTVYFADNGNYGLYKLPAGASTPVLLAGSGDGTTCYVDGEAQNCADGSGPNVLLGPIVALEVNSQGVAYALEGYRAGLLRRISPQGEVKTIVGNLSAPVNDTTDGSGAAAALSFSSKLSFSLDGSTLYIGSNSAYGVRVVQNLNAAAADVSTVLKEFEVFTQPPTSAKSATLEILSAVAADASGHLYVNDVGVTLVNGQPTAVIAVRNISPQGGLSLVGSTALYTENFSDLRVGPDGLIYVAGSCSIERMNPNGSVTTLTGDPTQEGCYSASQDGPAGTGSLRGIRSIAPDAEGNVYFTESQKLRRLAKDGAISTLTLVNADETPFPMVKGMGIHCDAAGQLYVATGRQVFKVAVQGATGTATLVAGNAALSGSDDGDALTQATFSGANGLSSDAAGNLYVADGSLLRMISPGGRVRTLAGNTNEGQRADGLGTDAKFGGMNRITVTPGGEVYVVDGRFLRKVEAIKENRL